MNKIRRRTIENVARKIEIAKEELKLVLNEEQNVFDNMPENLQGSTRGEESEEACDTLDELIDSLEDIIDELRGI